VVSAAEWRWWSVASLSVFVPVLPFVCVCVVGARKQWIGARWKLGLDLHSEHCRQSAHSLHCAGHALQTSCSPCSSTLLPLLLLLLFAQTLKLNCKPPADNQTTRPLLLLNGPQLQPQPQPPTQTQNQPNSNKIDRSKVRAPMAKSNFRRSLIRASNINSAQSRLFLLSALVPTARCLLVELLAQLLAGQTDRRMGMGMGRPLLSPTRRNNFPAMDPLSSFRFPLSLSLSHSLPLWLFRAALRKQPLGLTVSLLARLSSPIPKTARNPSSILCERQTLSLSEPLGAT